MELSDKAQGVLGVVGTSTCLNVKELKYYAYAPEEYGSTPVLVRLLDHATVDSRSVS
jgi:hypothetical protein